MEWQKHGIIQVAKDIQYHQFQPFLVTGMKKKIYEGYQMAEEKCRHELSKL